MTNTPDRRTLQKQETRERMLEACRQLLLSEGFHGLTMRKLAAKIGYSATAIYFHFPEQKMRCLGELVEREFIKFRRGFDQAGQPGSDPIERLRKMGMIYVAFGLEQTAAYKFLFMNTQIEQFPKIGLIEQGNPAQAVMPICGRRLWKDWPRADFALSSTIPINGRAVFSSTHGVVSLHLAKWQRSLGAVETRA